MAAIVVVASPAALSPESPIYLLANEPLVVATPFIEWSPAPADPGGAARVQSPTCVVVRVFTPKSSISRVPADLAAARAMAALNVRLQDACWSRLFTELTASGLFANGSFQTEALFEEALTDLVLVTPANLAITAADWRAGQAFVLPAGAGAVAVAAREAMNAVRFLNLASAASLEVAGSPLPLLPLALVVGMVGSCLTNAIRQQETSAIQLVAGFIRANTLHNASDGALASRLKSFVIDNRLPRILRAHGVSEEERQGELEDGYTYNRVAEGRRVVESQRVLLLDDGCVPTLHPLPMRAALLSSVRRHCRFDCALRPV